VAAPDSTGDGLLSVPLRDASLSTSANSERVRTVAGKEAGHLLDPRTGTFVRLPGSVSVLAPTGALADALSTAWAVEGPGAFHQQRVASPFRKAGAVAFVLRSRDGGFATLSDRPFQRLRPPARVAFAAIPRR
jgi:thiamine biosynthesis lipoprotein ApbE